MFWTDLSTDGVLESKAIVYFSGVLGIYPYELAYRTAYDYTPYLLALLWVGRLLILPSTSPGQHEQPTPIKGSVSAQKSAQHTSSVAVFPLWDI
jgi:hypothetical protein